MAWELQTSSPATGCHERAPECPAEPVVVAETVAAAAAAIAWPFVAVASSPAAAVVAAATFVHPRPPAVAAFGRNSSFASASASAAAGLAALVAAAVAAACHLALDCHYFTFRRIAQSQNYSMRQKFACQAADLAARCPANCSDSFTGLALDLDLDHHHLALALARPVADSTVAQTQQENLDCLENHHRCAHASEDSSAVPAPAAPAAATEVTALFQLMLFFQVTAAAGCSS